MKQRFLFILHLPPPVHGSAVVGQQIHDSRLIREGSDVSFINLNTSNSIDDIGKVGFRKLWIYLGILWEVFLSLVSNRPQLCYMAITVKGTAFLKDSFIVVLVKLFRVPIIYHLHNKGVKTYQDQWPYRWLYPFVFRNTRVILLSKYLYPDIARFVPETAVEYCPNGIPDMAGSAHRKSSNRIPRILFLSNLIESKGVFVLLDACRILKQRKIAFQCDFIGGEGDISANQFALKISEFGLKNEVRYLGKRYGQDKNQALIEADIFCFPTYYHNETFGLVNLEAMQFSLPVVSTSEGGIPDVVVHGETGFIVAQCDSYALADKLEELIKDNKLRQRMGQAGRLRYKSYFTRFHFEERMAEILSTVLNYKRNLSKLC